MHVVGDTLHLVDNRVDVAADVDPHLDLLGKHQVINHRHFLKAGHEIQGDSKKLSENISSSGELTIARQTPRDVMSMIKPNLKVLLTLVPCRTVGVVKGLRDMIALSQGRRAGFAAKATIL